MTHRYLPIANLNFQKLFLKKAKKKFSFIYWILTLIILLGIFWLIPAALLHSIPSLDFTFFDSVYFTMVTFTTVGFGDLSITGHNYKFFNVFLTYLG